VACRGGGADRRPHAPQSWRQREAGERRDRRLIVKANYCKRDKDDRSRAKATIRYIAHRRDREGNKVTRDLFGFDGFVSKETAYRMIDDAPEKRRYYYRMIISPDPRRQDSYRDLDLQTLTIETMLKLEERVGTPIQFVAAIHDDHSPHRHVHTVVIHNGRRLTREDFAALRGYGKHRALQQRRFLNRRRRRELLASRSRSYRLPFAYARADTTKGQFYDRQASLITYECPVCGRYQALPFSKSGYRCLSDGMSLHRIRPYEQTRTRPRDFGFERELTLSP
jgi:hypothetical protein